MTQRLLCLLVVCLSISPAALAQFTPRSLTAVDTAFGEDFNSLAITGTTNATPPPVGWTLTETGGGARDNEQYAADNGGSTTGDTYSYGATSSTERAFGGLQSGTLIPVIGAAFTNNTGFVITTLQISYTGEQWRLGTAARTDQLDFQYSTNATSLSSGTWTDVNSLDFVTPNTVTPTGPKDGNNAAFRTNVSSSIAGLNIPNGATFWIRWNDLNASGSDDGLAVDDFFITANPGIIIPSLSINDATVTEGNSGTVMATFTVSLTSPANAGGVTFNIATANNTATTTDNDYVTNSLVSQTIPAGMQTYTFNVTVNGDTNYELDETFFVNVSNITGATAGDTQGVGTITNDDPNPPISINAAGVPVSENFNTLANTGTTNVFLPTGWHLTETGGGARDNEAYGADDGNSNSNTGDTYSYGATASTERAFGSLASGSLESTIGAEFLNNTGTMITSVQILYTGEQWRFGSGGDRLNFQLSTDATSLTTGTWTDYDDLDLPSPVTFGTSGPRDGNDPANQAGRSFNITGLSIPAGARFWIRWNDNDTAGNDDGLAIDDFNLVANTTLLTIGINDVSVVEGNSGTTTATFTISLSAPAPAPVTFNVQTQNGTATANLADPDGADYVAVLTTPVTIPMGQQSTTVSVTINGDTAVEPDQVFYLTLTNVSGALVADSRGDGVIVSDDVTLVAIHDIQGPGTTSPLATMVVTARGVVTGVRSNGFFIQEPDASVDANPNTSEGVFVFTSSAPPAAAQVGNLVQVTGTVTEFIPAQDLASPSVTEIGFTPTVGLISTGNPLPAAITLTSADTAPGAPADVLEEFEGMRVRVSSLTVVAPTQGNTNETNATGSSNGTFYGVMTGTPRPMREPGVELPHGAPPPPPCCVPDFDANNERIRVDSDGQVGAMRLELSTGAVLTNVVGPLDYGFRAYTILPDPSSPTVVTPGISPTPVSMPTADEVTVGSFNLERFFDTVDDPGIGEPVLTMTAFDNRLNKASLAIRDSMRTPDIVGVVEVENLNALTSLATKINNDAIAAGQPNPNYVAYLVEGNDIGGIDIGFLVKTSRVTVVEVVQEGKTTTYINPNNNTPETLNDRPPLRLNAVVNFADGRTFPVTVIEIHNRSLSGVDDPADGNRVRTKRRAQAEFVANLIQARQTANQAERIVVAGDFNAFEFNDGYVDVMGTIVGQPTPAVMVLLASADLVNPDLTNLILLEPQADRYSFSFDGNAQSLDHALINAAITLATDARRVEHARIDSDFPETERNNSAVPTRISDHDPLVVFLTASANTAPVNSLPPAQVTRFNTSITFSTGNSNAISISDADANGLPVQLTVTATNGTFTLASTTGLAFSAGDGTADAAMTFTGTITDINAALNGSSFTPTPAFVGGASVQFTTNDLGNSGTGGPQIDTDTLAITVSALPMLSISDASVTEGNTGTTTLIFTVTLTPSNTIPVTVDYTTNDGTAVAGSDYTMQSGQLTFMPTETTKTIMISVVGDTAFEAGETMTVTLGNPTNAVIGDGSGAGTILNDDLAPTNLTIVKTAVGAPPYGAGLPVTYNISVSNGGPNAASSVTVTDVLTAGTFVAATPSQGSCTGTTTVSCSLGVLASGASASITFTITTPTTPGTVINTASVTSNNVEMTPSDNTSSATVMTVAIADIPTLSEWMLFALLAMLVGIGVVKMRG